MGKKSDLESVHLVNHSKCMLAAFQNFRQDGNMLDVTLVCNGISLKAHKLVLSGCSPLFKDIISENPSAHPVIIFRDFEFLDLKAIIDFIYKGELSVPRERLMSALKVAEDLQIRGLSRSEPNKEKYEKLYNQVREKLSNRKKRKRHRHDSSHSEESINISESDQNVVESEESLSAGDDVPSESMEVESAKIEENSTTDNDIRPVVLRVGDPAVNNGELIPQITEGEEDCNTICSVERISSDDNSQKNSIVLKEEIKDQINVLASESVAENVQVDSSVVCSDNFVSLESIPTDDQNNFQEQSIKAMSPSKGSEKVGLISSSCSSPKSLETQKREAELQSEGKRFTCSKCDISFTSRINFMRHKTIGHKNMEKTRPYECKHCKFTTEDIGCFKTHSLIHSDKVPYKCNICPEEFTSEELYKNHLSVHEAERTSLHDLSPTSMHDLSSTQNRSFEKNLEFRCSICFIKFTSKLRCQIHEKMCQGGS